MARAAGLSDTAAVDSPDLIVTPPIDAAVEDVSAFSGRDAAEPRCRRLLLTLLFTDIVGSTRLAEQLGDSAWHGLLHRQRALVRAQLARQGGREVDSCGDSFFAIFP